jgi:hypothetical protein
MKTCALREQVRAPARPTHSRRDVDAVVDTAKTQAPKKHEGDDFSPPAKTDDRRLYFFFFVLGAAFLVAFFIGKTPFLTWSG